MLLALGVAVVGLALLARVASRMGIPAIPFYLVAGLAFGEGGLIPLGATEELVRIGAEIGVILLLFMLGLEHPASELVAVLRRSVRPGIVDLVANFTPGFLGGLILGWGIVPSLFIGAATYVSSSGIAAKLVADLAIGPAARRLVLALLIIEDLVIAAMLPLLGATVSTHGPWRSIVTVLVAVTAVVGLLALALRVDVGLSKLLFSRSDEALLLSILGFSLVVAGLAEAIEVSAGVGALLAGIMISGPATEKAAPVLSPVRDLFAAIFFTFVGLSVDPRALPPVLVPAALLAVVTAATKLGTGAAGLAMDRVVGRQRLHAGAALIARGEFSLAIAGIAVAASVEPSPAPLIVAYVVMLAVAGPIVAHIATRGEPGVETHRPPQARDATS